MTAQPVITRLVDLYDVPALADGETPVSEGGALVATGVVKKLAPTAVKTANYAAAANDLVPVDTTAGNVTVTLPTAPEDGTRITVKMVAQAASHTVTISRGGTTDVFNKAGGSTSVTLTLLNQALSLQYKASTGIWYVVADDIPLSGLDARYTSATAGAFSAPGDVTIMSDSDASGSGDIIFSTGTVGELFRFSAAGVPRGVVAKMLGWYVLTDPTYGAKGDGKSVGDGTTTAASTTVTSPTAAFTSADVGKLIVLRGAGAAGAPLVTTIAAFTSSTSIVLTAAAGTSIAGTASVLWGTDDTAAFNAWAAAFNAAGGVAYAPHSQYMLNPDATAITQFTAKGRVLGDGPRSTIFQVCSRTNDGLSRATDHLYFEHLEVRCAPGTPTAGVGLRFASGQLGGMTNVRVSSFWNNVQADSAYNWVIDDDCYIVDAKNYGVYVQDLASNDRGDQCIGGVIITSVGGTGSAGIRYESGGGLKFGKLKVTNADYGLDLAVVDGAATSIALLSTVSFETQAVNNVRIGRVAGGTTGVFNDVHFSSFEFLIAAGKTNVQIGAGISNISFASGVMTGSGAGSIGIDVQGGANVAIGGGVTFANMETPIKDNGAAATRLKIDHDGVIYSNVTNEPSIVSKTSNYTIDRTNRYVLADASGGAFTVTLPTAVNARGRRYTVKQTNTGANAVTVATTSSQTIDGATTSILTPFQALELVSDGTNWRAV